MHIFEWKTSSINSDINLHMHAYQHMRNVINQKIFVSAISLFKKSIIFYLSFKIHWPNPSQYATMPKRQPQSDFTNHKVIHKDMHLLEKW